VPGERIEQRLRLRAEQPPAATTLVPLLGISVFAVLGEPLDDLLRRRFATFRTIYLPTAGRLAEYGFELLPTAQRPHFTVHLRRADDQELVQLLEALGAPQSNPAYPGSAT
jgi:hypothetical protein